MKVSLLQVNPGLDRDKNLRDAQRLLERAIAEDSPDLLVLPEYFEFYGGSAEDRIAAAESLPGGAAYTMMQSLATSRRVWIHAGSMLERIPGENRIFNTTVVFNRDGEEVIRYRKIHLFDIVTPDGSGYAESASVKPGTDVVLYDLEGLTVGCAICYDLRFGELFISLAQRGAEVIVLPSAFTLQTGKDHWEVLTRARAIETQVYLVACSQWGAYAGEDGGTRYTYGHSLVCDPWGHVVAQASDGVGFVTARIDPMRVKRVRSMIPIKDHRRLSCG